MPEGYGIMCSVLLRNRVEQGWFHNGLLEGRGRILEYLELGMLRMYEGDVKQNKPHGQGNAKYFPSGETHSGSWVHGNRSGKGK